MNGVVTVRKWLLMLVLVLALVSSAMADTTVLLDGGDDGLIFYRAITEKAKSALVQSGFVLYEVGIGQAEDVALIGEANGFKAEIYPDLSGIMRAVLLKTT